MKHQPPTHLRHRRQAGQTLVMFVVMAVALIGIVGLALDAGNVYVTRSALSKSVDAAVLTGMRNLAQGDTIAESLARRAFASNFKGGGREATPVSVNVAFSRDASNNKRIRVSATTVLDTYFIRIFPQFRTVPVSCTAEGTRAKLIMAVVLDRSGSMNNNGGNTQLPPAVTSFVNYFDDNNDDVAVTSFASHARVDVTMRKPFKSAVTSAVNAMSFTGGTFADGGLTLGYNQIQTIPVTPGENVVKVAIFFTDGFANEFQYTFSSNRTHNIGGYDSGNIYGVFNPSTGSQLATCNPYPPTGYTYISSFVSITGTTMSLTSSSAGNNVRLEARLRTEATATTMRNNGITIYSIGLGTDSTIDQSFLRRIANDPASTTYDPDQPSGLAVVTPNSAELKQLFDTIAARILLRLTQ